MKKVGEEIFSLKKTVVKFERKKYFLFREEKLLFSAFRIATVKKKKEEKKNHTHLFPLLHNVTRENIQIMGLLK